MPRKRTESFPLWPPVTYQLPAEKGQRQPRCPTFHEEHRQREPFHLPARRGHVGCSSGSSHSDVSAADLISKVNGGRGFSLAVE